MACDVQVIAHMMPDLPNVGWERDMESFREFFENPAFRSDGLKVGLCSMHNPNAPCCVVVVLSSSFTTGGMQYSS